jgi:hypothetical protein
MINVFYPKIRLSLLPTMLGYAALGSLFAGAYGVLHDEVTYSICPEYFTRLKFSQFHYANFGWPTRIFVAEIGFLATWWVGFFSAWFIARITVPALSRTAALRYNIRGFVIIVMMALAASFVGFTLSQLHGPDYSAWQDLTASLGVVDVPGFVKVAYIHNTSYLGGLIGLIVALIYVRTLRNKLFTSANDGRKHSDSPSGN